MSTGERPACDIMAGRQRGGAEIARGIEQVGELDLAVARDAGHRRLAREVAFGEAVYHLVAKSAFVVQDVMGDAERLGDAARVMDVLPRAA